MSIVAPEGRKHLSADALFRLVQNGFDTIPDHRLADTEISLTHALMATFAMLFLKAPSLLAFDKERAEGNLATIYGIESSRATRACVKSLIRSSGGKRRDAMGSSR
jgi:hypothetical protein